MGMGRRLVHTMHYLLEVLLLTLGSYFNFFFHSLHHIHLNTTDQEKV